MNATHSMSYFEDWKNWKADPDKLADKLKCRCERVNTSFEFITPSQT